MFFLEYIEYFFGSYPFIFATTCGSFILKACLLIALLRKTIGSATVERPLIFLLATLIGNMFSDFAWMIKLTQTLFIPQLSYSIVLFFIRIAWVFFIIQYQSLALFIESLVTQRYQLPMRQKLFIGISFCFGLAFILIAVFDFYCPSISQRKFAFEPTTQNLATFYALFPLMLTSLFAAIQKIRSARLPFILTKQIKIFIQVLIAPLLVADFIQLFPFKTYAITLIAHSYAAVGFTTILLTLSIYFCSRKIFGLRFLNFKGHVQQPMNLNFIDDFKGVLERLSSVTNFRELGHITQNFFKDTFNIPFNKTSLYFKKMSDEKEKNHTTIAQEHVMSLVETFMATNRDAIEPAIKEEQILIYDEIDFTHFYHACEKSTIILQFLRAINADIFLPIYVEEKLIAYIIVDRHARMKQFYSNVERDELIVFSSYVGNIINLLQNKNFDILIEQEQSLRKELFHKHQEIDQYKESIKSFLRKNKTQHIGIIFYKNKKFTYGNQAAKELIDININTQHGHPTAQLLRKLADTVEAFKAPQTAFSKDFSDNTIIICAVPHLEQSTVIITVSYPDISDMIKHHIDLLKDPTEWDYLLYLQTTRSGKLINQLIPAAGPVLLNFKINLLKIALSKKAILLEMAEEDLTPTVQILHHISLRDILHTITLSSPSTNFDLAIALFGINPIFGFNKKSEQPLLEKLDNVGTLFIKNIHFLDIESQEYLAQFIRYGFYTLFKSDQKVVSNVRIICSSNQNLSVLAQEGKFSKVLLQELQSTKVAMPSLLTLSEEELHNLTEGFSQQAIISDTLNNMLVLSPKEKSTIATKRPASLQELKSKIQHLLIKKSKKNQIYHDVEFDPAYDITDPDLMLAARLGKQALKDEKTMILLWNKFKNQNKISVFLGVNRSSVNRRCKKYNLL